MYHCCLETSFDLGWFCAFRSRWRAALEFGHCTHERGSSRVLAGGHNEEIYSIHSTDHDRFYVSAGIPECDLGTNCLLLVSSLPAYAYYSYRILDGDLCSLVLPAARTEIAVCMLVWFLSVAFSEVPNTFDCETRLAPSIPCLINLSSTLSNLVRPVSVCSIIYESSFEGLFLFA